MCSKVDEKSKNLHELNFSPKLLIFMSLICAVNLYFAQKLLRKAKILFYSGAPRQSVEKAFSICDANYSGIHRVINFFKTILRVGTCHFV